MKNKSFRVIEYFALALLLFQAVAADLCVSGKCTCALQSMRCVQITENEQIFEQLNQELVGLGFAQSRIVITSEAPFLFPNVQYLALKDTSYLFKNLNPFPNLITLELQGGTKYMGFPPNNISVLIIKSCQNLIGKPLLSVLRNVSVEFPHLRTLILQNMELTFKERDWRAPPLVFPHLKDLDLSGNKIESLLVLNKISQWWKLSHISLNNNVIQHTPLSHIKQVANAEFEPDAVVLLEMSSQNMHCTCDQKDLQSWLRATEFFKEPRHIKCSFPFDTKHGEFSLLEVAYLCDTERKSTAVNVYGLGKIRSSLVALGVTSGCVSLLAFFVMLCHYRKVHQGLKRLKKFLCDHPNLEMQADGRPLRMALGRK